MSSNDFGSLADGRAVEIVRLAGGGIVAEVLSYGAILRDLRLALPGGERRLVLGFDRIADYEMHSPYFGAVVGRCANRIGAGRFQLDGRDHQLDLNDGGRAHLHGGVEGFDRKLWTIEAASTDSVTLTLGSPDGDQGYPGTVQARCRYTLPGEGVLVIELEAETDAPTPVNLATHSYFNLAGTPDILGHVLEIPAEAYLPVDGALIPTGEIRPVAGTGFDFRKARPIGAADRPERGYDHNFVVAEARSNVLRLMARLTAPAGDVTLDIWSTEPGVQFYDGNMLEVPVPGLDGARYALNGGLCLEPQGFPDAVNRPEFPAVILRPGETYRQRTEYRLGAG
ncbi:aldose epimerase family protein [Methylobrevis albus]|uniref:Aldose 1-epimerase n=1 Tax=Methylobrevis albus TaxID=2793297 RepID=A0A931HYV7_9HYPH|nr:aldose epimerase family protein [Methylobrevis albus]MBH0236209.1 galactose mutarotase [Methylobrevis albus]